MRWGVIGVSTVMIITVIVLAVTVVTLGDSAPPRVASTTRCLPTPVVQPPTTTTTDTLSVALNASGTTTQLVLGTNIQAEADILPATTPRVVGTLNLFQQWQPQMVRLHMGYRTGGTSDAITLPGYKEGDWDFSRLDATIQQLRDHNISYFLDIRTAPPWMFDSVGQLPDAEFPAFAQFMARLVGWYNKGGFTDEKGVYHQSGHYGWVKYWEIWNEPKSGWDIPGNVPDRSYAPWMTPDRFANLYDVTSTAMKAVDPTILTGGPAINSYPDIPYLQTFIQDETAPLNFFSLHFYAGTNYQEPDAQVYDAVTGDRFLNRIVAIRQLLNQYKPGQNIPIWVDELNFNEASTIPIDLRGTGPAAYPFIADSLVNAAYQGIAVIDQFTMSSDAQFGLNDITSGQVYRPFWLFMQFSHEFPAGSYLLPVKITANTGLVAMAALAPNKQSLQVMVGNIQAAHATDVNGQGVAHTVPITITGTYQGATVDLCQAAQVWNFDRTVSPASLPAPTNALLTPHTDGSFTLQQTLLGYGVQIISIPLKVHPSTVTPTTTTGH